MRVEILKKSSYRRMLWGNGLGETEQIHIYPTGSVFPGDSFLWRLSSATVTGSNEFSNFPEYDRILVVWKGRGLKLNDRVQMQPFKPYTFPGEIQTRCELIGNEHVVDLGIIFRRELVHASMTIESISNRSEDNILLSHVIPLAKGHHYLVLISGKFSIKNDDIHPGDTLLVERRDMKQWCGFCYHEWLLGSCKWLI